MSEIVISFRRSKSLAVGVAISAAAVAALLAGVSTRRGTASTGPIPLNCDPACLEGVMNQYLAAVVAHDPSRVPQLARLTHPNIVTVFDFGASARRGRSS